MTDTLVIGADVGGTAVKYAAVDDAGSVRIEGEIPTDAASAHATLAALADAVATRLGDDWPRVRAVGLACAGIVDPAAGTLGRAPNLLGWENSDLAGAVADTWDGRPCALVNDVNGALVGEWRFGAGRGLDDLVMLALGTGVGGGIVVHGQLVVGNRCGAAELGHMILDPDGPPCGCGNRGCLEAYAGARGLVAEARRRADADPALADLCAGDPTPESLAALAADGNAAALSLFRDAGRMLGLAVGNLVNALDPDVVIIGGGVARAGDLLLGPCRETAPGVVLGERSRAVPIVAAALGNRAAAMGAAALAREKVDGG